MFLFTALALCNFVKSKTPCAGMCSSSLEDVRKRQWTIQGRGGRASIKGAGWLAVPYLINGEISHPLSFVEVTCKLMLVRMVHANALNTCHACLELRCLKCLRVISNLPPMFF